MGVADPTVAFVTHGNFTCCALVPYARGSCKCCAVIFLKFGILDCYDLVYLKLGIPEHWNLVYLKFNILGPKSNPNTTACCTQATGDDQAAGDKSAGQSTTDEHRDAHLSRTTAAISSQETTDQHPCRRHGAPPGQ